MPELPAEPGWSILYPLANESLLLDVASAGARLVAVGERGHVLLSDDQGRSWRQVRVPTRAMLTGVFFVDGRRGYAVGHDAVILRTDDGGETWQPVHDAPELEQPLFDVWFRDADSGFACGAYGYFLVTEDAGETWTKVDVVDEEAQGEDEFYGGGIEYHLNATGATPDRQRLYMAAEAGAAYRSDNTGRRWATLTTPYEGSYFGVLPLDGDSVLLFGLRGHLYRSDDAGATWSQLPTDTTAMLTDGVRLADGEIVIVGLAGTVLRSTDGGRSFASEAREDRMGISAILETADGAWILVGEGGAVRVED